MAGGTPANPATLDPELLLVLLLGRQAGTAQVG
jgi:hypothetical protein